MFIGRKKELKILDDKFASNRAELVVIYGRRRVGKSALIDNFIRNKKSKLVFEGIENENSRKQIEKFRLILEDQFGAKLQIPKRFKNWDELFIFITKNIFKQRNKFVLVIDELQWAACGKSSLISLLKYYWDNHWKQKNVMLILCGSVASFMVKKVIKSTALYGRINTQILLKPLEPNEAIQMFKNKKSKEEVLQYLLVYGGIPKYLEEIDLSKSFKQNINALCFSSEGFLFNEADAIFYKQFKESQTYLRIAKLLNQGPLSLELISQKLSLESGGGLKSYLDNLELAGIVKSYNSFGTKENSKYKKYKIVDEFLIFYFKFIAEYTNQIKNSKSKDYFSLLVKPVYEAWFGIAFERFCFRYADYIAEKMGFADEVLSVSPFFTKTDIQFQIDMIFTRADKTLVIVEVKYHNKEIQPQIITEMERKISLLKIPQGYSVQKALISLKGPNKVLKASGYFDHSLELEDLF